MAIKRFTGAYAFLSNFDETPFEFDEVTVKSCEEAFQMSKTTDPAERERIRLTSSTPAQVKKAGRAVKLRPDWEEVKDKVMLEAVRAKFRIPELRKKLLETGDEVLIEGNTWHDNYWGNCTCQRCVQKVGKNMLGKILMKVRQEVRDGKW